MSEPALPSVGLPFIHRSAWKEHFRKSAYGILHETGSRPFTVALTPREGLGVQHQMLGV
jgi:hypothetical protein